jgi:rhamnosyltransferase
MKIGEMSEELFIDYVDFEWCWRARACGIATMCFPDIVINHCLGDSSKRIAGKKVTVRSDFRYYHMLRNGFYLARTCRFLNMHEREILLKRTILFTIGIILIAKRKLRALGLVINALIDSRKMSAK